MNRSPALSPSSRASPLPSTRREVADVDPLLDSGRVGSGGEAFFPEPARAPPADPVDAITEDFLKNCKVHPHSLPPAAPSLSALASLVNNANWVEVVAMSKDLLVDSIEKDAVLACRFEALFRLKQYDELTVEVSDLLPAVEADCADGLSRALLDRAASLRLLLSEVKCLSGRSSEAFEALRSLQDWLDALALLPSAGPHAVRLKFWSWHVSCHVCNAHVRLRSWRSALRLLRDLSAQLDQLLPACANEEERCDVTNTKVVLLCRASKLFLQIGAVKAATSHHDLACRLMARNPPLAADGYLQAQTLLLQGLLQFSEEKFEVAIDTFGTLIETERLRGTGTGTASLDGEDTLMKAVRSVLWRQLDDCPLSAAVNNHAVCCLYLKKNSAAIARLEELLAQDPQAFMTDPVIFNLCTIYDLCYAPDISNNKKKALQRVAARYQISESVLHWRSFRLN